MDFFVILQDKRIPDIVEPMGASKVISKDVLNINNADKLERLLVQFQIKEKTHNEYVDYIECPVQLVSDKLKRLLEKYDSSVFFIPVMLADLKNERQEIYWLMVPDVKDCLSPQTEFNKDGTLKKLVIDERKAALFKVFKVKGLLENLLVIRLDVAESILRRDYAGIKLKKVAKEKMLI